MTQKNLPPSGRMPFTRRLLTGEWDTDLGLGWLPLKLEVGRLDAKESEANSIDRVAREQLFNNFHTDTDNDKNQHNDSYIPNDNISICSNSSSNSSSSNNLGVDDVTK